MSQNLKLIHAVSKHLLCIMFHTAVLVALKVNMSDLRVCGQLRSQRRDPSLPKLWGWSRALRRLLRGAGPQAVF